MYMYNTLSNTCLRLLVEHRFSPAVANHIANYGDP